MDKVSLGQFYTTNYEYILDGMYIPESINKIIEPFVGNGDLLKFIKNKKIELELYDIDPKINNAIKRDTLINPPIYDGKFILTNPPYIARNKNKNKEIYDKYNQNDLYKCFISSIIGTGCIGGIIIIPVNFLSSIRKADIELRKNFIKKFTINRINIFEERVFNDTNYAICSIQYTIKEKEGIIKTIVYPQKKEIELLLSKKNNYTIGGELFKLPMGKTYKIGRATSKTPERNITNILLKCIDDSKDNRICLKIIKEEERYIDTTNKLSARSYATLTSNIEINEEELVEKFNNFIEEQREKYNSLFLPNYRDAIARKRIPFTLAFRICNYIINS